MPEQIEIGPLTKVLASLEAALAQPTPNDVERDGIIQRFEYTFELSWKMMRRYLLALGRSEVSASPRPVLRDALQEKLIDDIPTWFAFLEARNLASHVYDENEAAKVYAYAQRFPPHVRHLIDQLQKSRG